MASSARDMFDEMEEIGRELRRMTETAFGQAFLRFDWRTQRQTWTPLVDVCEGEDEVFVLVELPGVEKDEIDLEYQSDFLIVRGERHRREAPPLRRCLMLEIMYGPFERAIPLPAPIDPENIQAVHRAGILEVRLPKMKNPKIGKIIKVEVR